MVRYITVGAFAVKQRETGGWSVTPCFAVERRVTQTVTSKKVHVIENMILNRGQDQKLSLKRLHANMRAANEIDYSCLCWKYYLGMLDANARRGSQIVRCSNICLPLVSVELGMTAFNCLSDWITPLCAAERLLQSWNMGRCRICFGYKLSSPLGSWMKIKHYFISVIYSGVGFEDLEEYN